MNVCVRLFLRRPADIMHKVIREGTNCGRGCSFSLSLKDCKEEYMRKGMKVQDRQIKTCRKKQHVDIDKT